MKKLISSIFIICFAVSNVSSQDDLLDFLEAEEEPITDYTVATFKTTRVLSAYSAEVNSKGVLQFLIGHRFGRISSGVSDWFGLDNSTIRLGFEYGITDNFNIGIGRSSFQKTFDGMVKWKFLKQKSGHKNFPFTATYVGTMYLNGAPWSNPGRENFFSSRLYYHNAILIARKFNDFLSMQLTPAVFHRNIVEKVEDKNTVINVGIASSMRLSGSTRFNVEYLYNLPNQIVSTIGGEKVRNSLSVGIDLETGGHIFQLFVSNSRGMTEKILIGETTGNWLNGDIHFGFNISRVFTVQKPKEFKHD